MDFKKIESMLESLKFLKMMKKDFGEYIIRAITVRDNLNLWDDKGTHTQRLLKRSLIDFLCRIQNAECLRTSTKYYEQISSDYFLNPNQVSIGFV